MNQSSNRTNGRLGILCAIAAGAVAWLQDLDTEWSRRFILSRALIPETVVLLALFGLFSSTTPTPWTALSFHTKRLGRGELLLLVISLTAHTMAPSALQNSSTGWASVSSTALAVLAGIAITTHFVWIGFSAKCAD